MDEVVERLASKYISLLHLGLDRHFTGEAKEKVFSHFVRFPWYYFFWMISNYGLQPNRANIVTVLPVLCVYAIFLRGNW